MPESKTCPSARAAPANLSREFSTAARMPSRRGRGKLQWRAQSSDDETAWSLRWVIRRASARRAPSRPEVDIERAEPPFVLSQPSLEIAQVATLWGSPQHFSKRRRAWIRHILDLLRALEV